MMRAAALLGLAVALSACAPNPASVPPAPAAVPLVADRGHEEECSLIRDEIARQQRIAEMSPAMDTLLVEAAVRLNASNVIYDLRTRAAIEGCGV
jgi:hypothetical protein